LYDSGGGVLRAIPGAASGAPGRFRMDGRGRAFAAIFAQRLWRMIKHEEFYLKDFRPVIPFCLWYDAGA